jgi:hypothetical protein
MNRTHFHTVLFVALLAAAVSGARAQLVPNLGGQRAGIAAYQFLKIAVDARAAAMGETFVAVANDASALYWNPAGLVQFDGNEVILSHTEYVIDLKHEFAGVSYHLTPNDAVGISVISLHTDDMEITTETQPNGTGRYFTFGDLGLGASYARRMTDQFSFGVTVRYVQETLDILKMRGLMVDIGTYYWTGLGSSRFAVVVSNFGSDVSPSGEAVEFNGATVNSFQSFSPPTQFKLGLAMEPYTDDLQRVTTTVELNHPNDNAENVHLGIEYQYAQWLWLRGGLKRTIGERLLARDNSASGDYALGLGVAAPLGEKRLMVDYAFSNFNLLGGLHRFTLRMGF